ncbi:MAG: SDR family NAD(P)-dependent oxidoreductase [Acidobacteria bacterium]|uniref:SDR family NAD(P)-dependent oxidoreductase n=1 Tax=Candidatus Polarisedimenticola svalbardensis TaxID=2886004 RepID=A0A8J6Y6F8_9BACT|nr:SDR family NAD(P)-dependent oxidoreductase [Candidatus Polarisedimenticola svalbardensis]
MAFDLHGKNVLVTGASEGIGLATAKRFVELDANVWALARNRERLEALSAELGGPPRLVPVTADVSDGPAMETVTGRILSELGVPDVIVANAGISLDARFENTTDEDLESVYQVNVFGLVRSIRPFLPAMKERGSGRIIFVSSVIGKRGIPNYTAYSGSKFALHGMAEALRPELTGTGVKVGIVCPSSTESELRQRMKRIGPQQSDSRIRRHSAESVAGAIVKMVRTGKREMVLSFEGKLMNWINRISPGLMDRILAKVLVE